MNKEEWTNLDDSLRKEGFGGYYDLMECLRDSTEIWLKEKHDRGALTHAQYIAFAEALRNEKSLKGMVGALQSLAAVKEMKP